MTSLPEHVAIEEFRQAMADQGIPCDGEIVGDSTLRRYTVFGDKKSSRTGWYVLHTDGGKPAGAFGCNKRFGNEQKFIWSSKNPARPLTVQERRAWAKKMATQKAKKEAGQAEERAAAASHARYMWGEAKDCGGSDHPYLARKGVKSYGLKVGAWEKIDRDTCEVQTISQQALLIPIRDTKKNIHSLQAIFTAPVYGDRDKDFLKGGAKEGLFYTFGRPQLVDVRGEQRKVIMIGEGYATLASAHEATGLAAVVAFDAGQLLPVARSMRTVFPDAVLLFLADNDQWTLEPIANPGLTKAREAAAAVGGLVAVPPFAASEGMPGKGGKIKGPTDFNDWHQRHGLESVHALIEAALNPPAGAVAPASDAPADDPPLRDDEDHVLLASPVAAARADANWATTPGDGNAVITLEASERSPSAPPMFSPAEMLPSQLPKSADARDGSSEFFALTEKGNSYRLANMHGQDIRFVSDLNEFMAWVDGRWVPDRGDRILRAAVGRLPKVIRAEAAFHATEGMPEDAGHALKWAQKSDSAAVIGNTVTLLKDVAQLQVQFRSIDADPMLAGFDGGRQVVDLRTGAIRQALRGDLVTRTLGVSALGDASKAVRWQSFLLEVFSGDRELIDWFTRFMGYGLSGLYTEQIFLFLHGSGANGKSVLLKVLGALFGGYGAVVHAGTLMEQQRTGKEASPDVLGMAGARLLLGSEVAQGEAFDERFIKSWTGGDLQKARPLHGKIVDFEPIGKLMIAGNHRPRIVGTDPAVWRRVRLVPFRRQFAEHERDPGLSGRLIDELPHIAAWAVAGCREWQQRGLADTPQSVKAASSEYAVEQDTLGEFLAEKTDPGGECASADLFKVYVDWAQSCNIRPISRQAFGRQLRERGYGGRHTRDGKVLDGLCLRSALSAPF